MNTNLIKKFLSFSYGSVISMIFGFISIPILTRLLTPDEYGKITLFITITGILATVLTFGTEQSFVRFFYEEEEINRPRLLRKTLIVPIILTILFITIMLGFGEAIASQFFNEYSFLLLFFLIIYTIIMALTNYAMLVIRMQQKGHMYSLLQIVNKAIYVLGIILFAYFLNTDYKIAIWSLIISQTITLMIAVFSQVNYWFSFKTTTLVPPMKNSSRDILYFAFPAFITLFVNWVFQASDKFALQYMTDYKELGVYASATTFLAVLGVVQTAFTAFWTPVVYKTFEENPNSQEFFRKGSQIVTLLMIVLAIVVVLFRDLFVLLLGSSYHEAIYIIPMLLFIPIAYTISETTQIGINLMKKPKYHVMIAFLSAIVNVVFLLLLVPDFGAKGAAIATALGYIIFFTFRTYFSVKLYEVKYGLPKLFFSILILFSYMLLLTFNDTSMITILIGLCILLLVVWLYNDSYKLLIGLIKPYLNRLNKTKP